MKKKTILLEIMEAIIKSRLVDSIPDRSGFVRVDDYVQLVEINHRLSSELNAIVGSNDRVHFLSSANFPNCQGNRRLSIGLEH